eukprot:3941583-Rhodomonas_salina.7
MLLPDRRCVCLVARLCPVSGQVAPAIALRVSYAMSGTGIGCAAIACVSYAMSGTDLAYPDTHPYHATLTIRGVRY